MIQRHCITNVAVFKSIILVELEIRRSSFNLWHWQLWFPTCFLFQLHLVMENWEPHVIFRYFEQGGLCPSPPITAWNMMKNDHADFSLLFFHNSFMCAVQETILEPHFARHAQCFVISCLTVIHVATGLTLLAHQITIYLLLGIGSGIFLCCSNYCYYYYILILLVKKVRQIGSRLWISQGHVRKPTDHVKSPIFFGFRFHRILTGLSKLRWLNRRFLHQLTIIQLGVIMVVACRLTPFKTLWSLVPISRRPLRK